MPPRTRKSKPAPAAEEENVTEANDATVETTEPGETTEEVEAPKRRGRTRSELAHAAREFEKWSKVANILEERYAVGAERLSVTAADLATAREHADAAKAKLDAALNG